MLSGKLTARHVFVIAGVFSTWLPLVSRFSVPEWVIVFIKLFVKNGPYFAEENSDIYSAAVRSQLESLVRALGNDLKLLHVLVVVLIGVIVAHTGLEHFHE